MLGKGRFIALGLLLSLAGCAQLPEEMALTSKTYSAQNAGLVVGALVSDGPYGTWLQFSDINTGKTYGWGAKDYYSVWLPAGDYQVSELGARRGVMGPFAAPLRFRVQNGVINYVGELVYGCPRYPAPTAYYGVKNCGLLALATCTVPNADVGMCVVDRQPQALKRFLRANPAYTNMPINPALMK